MQSRLCDCSTRWKELIETEKIWPFMNWNILCISSDKEKSEALMRIINAGRGRATCYNFNKKFQDELNIYFVNHLIKNFESIKQEHFTLVIYDDNTKESGFNYSYKLSIPCYPYQAIPDYLIQCNYNRVPNMSTSYYMEKCNSNVDSDCLENPMEVEKINEDEVAKKCPITFLSSYNTYLLCAQKDPKFQLLDTSWIFLNLWQNNSYVEALDILEQSNQVPPVEVTTNLMEFIINFTTMSAQNFLSENDKLKTMKDIYKRIFMYLNNLLVNFPPVNCKLKNYYKKIFQNFELNFYSETYDTKTEMTGIIDIIYLMSIHDFLILNIGNSKKQLRECALLYCKINEKIFDNLFIKLKKISNVEYVLYEKLFKIISFIDTQLESKDFYKVLSSHLEQLCSQANTTGECVQFNKFFLLNVES